MQEPPLVPDIQILRVSRTSPTVHHASGFYDIYSHIHLCITQCPPPPSVLSHSLSLSQGDPGADGADGPDGTPGPKVFPLSNAKRGAGDGARAGFGLG